MTVLRIIDCVLITALLLMTISGCAMSAKPQEASPELPSWDAIMDEEEKEEKTVKQNETEQKITPVLLYMGQASIRIVTPENKVIYIDPYAGDAYDLPADLILVPQLKYNISLLTNSNHLNK